MLNLTQKRSFETRDMCKIEHKLSNCVDKK